VMSRYKVPLVQTCIVSALICIPAMPGAWAQSSTTPGQSQQNSAPVTGQPAMPPINRNQLPDNPTPQPSQRTTTTPVPVPQEPAIASQPTGAAAAEPGTPVGMAASRPAGAAIAPPKQREVRSFLIKLGVIAGAGVAVGTVAALSAASPARVPGSPSGH
jgi:hypothetical protein